MLQEGETSPASNIPALPVIGGSQQLPRQAKPSEANPTLLPDAVYFALMRQRKAEAVFTSRMTYSEIERGLKARLGWRF